MNEELKPQRTREQWSRSDPKLMAQQSTAAIMYAFQDAKRDIETLHRQMVALSAVNKQLREAVAAFDSAAKSNAALVGSKEGE